MKKLFAFFVILTAVVSCMQENELNPPQPLDVSIVAVASDTRTVLDGNAVKWMNEDKIALVLTGEGGSDVVEFTATVEGDAPADRAEFKGTIAPEASADKDDDVLAVYPYTAYDSDGGLSFTLPETQKVSTDGSFESGLNLSYASVSLQDITTDGEANAVFNNALAILRFTLPADITHVTITGTSALAGTASLSFKDGTLSVEEWSEQFFAVSPALTVGNEVYESNKTYNLLVWPGVHQSLTVEMTDEDGCTYKKERAGQIEFKASQYYELNFNEKFGKDFEVSLTGRDFAAGDEVAVALGELYNETLTVSAGPVIAGTLPHSDATVNGYAVYPASVTEQMEITLKGTADEELYYSALSSDDLFGDNASLEFKSALASLELTLPADIKLVSISSSSSPIIGTASLEYKDGVLSLENNDNPEVRKIDLTLDDRQTSLKVAIFPIESTELTVRITDSHDCVASRSFTGQKYEAGRNYPLDLSSSIPTKQYTIECDPDIEGPLMVAFGDDQNIGSAVKVEKEGKFIYDSHETYTTGYAFYPVDAYNNGAVAPSEQTTETTEPTLMSATLDFSDGPFTPKAEFTNAFATLKLTVPEGTTEVTLTSDVSLAGKMEVSDNQVVPVSEGQLGTVKSTNITDNICTIYVLPGTHTSLKAVIEDAQGTATKDFADLEFIGGETESLDLTTELIRPVTLNPSATVQHRFENGILTGSDFIFNLGVTVEEAQRISDLKVTLKQNGTIYRTYEGVPGAVTSVNISGNKVYLPHSKEYNVEYEYTDISGKTISESFTVTSEKLAAENFSYDVKYSIQDKTLYLEEAKINISAEVLSESPVNNNYTGYKYNSTMNDMTKMNWSYNVTSPILIQNESVTVSNYGTYYLYLYTYFDGIYICMSGIYPKVINIEGKKYRIKSENPINNSESLVDGRTYVICLESDSNKFWKNESSTLTLKENNLSGEFAKEFVFVCHRVNGSFQVAENYSYTSFCTWQSASDNKYLTEFFNFDASNALTFKCANGWRDYPSYSKTTSEDIDMYKDGSNMINWNGTWYWGHGVTTEYKWKIYEVE